MRGAAAGYRYRPGPGAVPLRMSQNPNFSLLRDLILEPLSYGLGTVFYQKWYRILSPVSARIMAYQGVSSSIRVSKRILCTARIAHVSEMYQKRIRTRYVSIRDTCPIHARYGCDTAYRYHWTGYTCDTHPIRRESVSETLHHPARVHV